MIRSSSTYAVVTWVDFMSAYIIGYEERFENDGTLMILSWKNSVVL